jgi:LPXTG-site transpeptidase (sortase) family protein
MASKKQKVIYIDGVFARIFSRKWSFLGIFIIVFFISFTALASIGIAPRGLTLENAFPGIVDTLIVPIEDSGITLPKGEGELPVKIEIPAIGIETSVANPESTKVADLDRALLGGAVRYPGTGVLGEKGNVLLFGHSSHLPVVHNRAYKAFNDIQNLKVGEPIYVYGEGKKYTYAVETVQQENTTTGAIPLSSDGARITLATCDNFGAKSDRFVVTAVLTGIENVQ